jgi:molybdate transport system ATP-binding protein
VSRLSIKFKHEYASGAALEIAFTTEASTTSLFGPSGSGKSSTLAVIAGLLRPLEARVEFDGRVWQDSSERLWVPPERRRVGVVFQDPLLFPHLSVDANLRYGLRRRTGAGPARIGRDRVVEVLELGPLLLRPPEALSGGERQRVGLGRALLRNPDLLLMDEPLAALDEPLKQRIIAYLDRVLREWRIPTLYVTHSQAEVRRLAHWVVAFRHGHVVDSGTPDDVLAGALEPDAGGVLGPTNLIRAVAVARPEGGWAGQLGSELIQLPDDAEPSDDKRFYVQFSPQSVSLLVGEVGPGLSARNRLSGTVERLVPHHGRVLVLVDVGQPLWAEVTPDAVAALDVRAGMHVTCVIKTTALRIIP